MTQPAEPHAASSPKSKLKPKSMSKSKPPTTTLDRWFKPAPDAVKTKNESVKHTESDAKDEKKPEKKAKAVGASRNFVQRYIHITDECRVCESAKTVDATRCELRCATCSMTVHKKCYNVKGELPEENWNCRRCQFIYDETTWEDISSLVGVAAPEGVTFPKCKPLDDTQKLHALHTDCNFAAVFLFLQRFRRLGLKLSNVVTTLESLATALLEPKDGGLCEELHLRLLANINVGMKKYPWYVHLLRFLREEEYPPAIAQGTKFPASSSEAEKREEFYFDLSVSERVAILKFLCETQFDCNDSLVEMIDNEDADTMRNDPIGVDAAGRSYFVLEDAATVPDAALWVSRCAKFGGTDWETVCNDLESVESLVQELSLSVESADLRLWQALSRGALKKLTRQQEKRKRNERWKFELAVSGVLIESGSYGGIGKRSLRNRQQVNYANIDVEEEEEENVADSEDEGDDDEASDGKSGDEADSETDGDDDVEEDEDQPRRSTRNSDTVSKKRKAQNAPTRSSKRIRHSPHEDSSTHAGVRRSTRNRGNVTTTSSSHDSDSDNSNSDDN